MIIKYIFESIDCYSTAFNTSIYDYIKNSFTYSKDAEISLMPNGFIIYTNDELSYSQFLEEVIFELKEFYSCKKILLDNTENNIFPEIILNEINDNNDITLYTTHSLILPVARKNKEIKNRFYSHFVNIFYKNDIPCAWDYTDYKSFYFQLFNETRLMYNSPIEYNNVSIFKDILFQGYYIFVWVDNYYISQSEFYNKIHDIHPILIYGMNIKQQKYICKIFSPRKGVCSETINNVEVHEAIDNAKFYIQKINDDNQILFFKPRVFESNYQFDSVRFIYELFNYINGIGHSEHLFFYFHFMPNISSEGMHYGINVIKAFAKTLINDVNYPFDSDYRVLHMVYEQIKLMYDRFAYISKELDLESEFIPIIKLYKEVLNSISLIRLLFIKFVLKETNKETFYILPKEPKHIDILYNKIVSFIELEKNVYHKIFPKIVETLILCQPKNKALLIDKAELISEIDNNMLSYTLTLKFESEVDSIRMFSLAKEYTNKLLSGKLVFDDGTVFLCDGTNAIEGIYDIKFNKPIKTKKIKFYPKEFYSGENSMYIGAYTYNLLNKANVYASSIFDECKLDYVSKENVLIDTQDSCWIPSVKDTDRHLDFIFKSVEEISCVKFRQLADAPRVKRYKVYYYNEMEKCWVCIVDYKDKIDSHLIINRFSMINTEKIRLEITETVYDETGYNVPHVTFFGAFKH